MKPFTAVTLLPAVAALRSRRLQFPTCNICGDGGVITNPDAVLELPQVSDEKTCAEYAIDGENGLISKEECDLLPFVTSFVCDCQFPTEVVAAPAPQEECSCSPREFVFQLQLERNCDEDTISGTPGIEDATCNFRGSASNIDLSTITVVDIQFLEFGTGVEVINQNDTFTNTSLAIGDTFSFPSISNMLITDMSIEEQFQYVPTGVSLLMEGKAKDNEGNEITIRNQVAWTYYNTNSCGDLPISVGQSIGWIDIVGLDAPLPDFCFSSPPTTTEPTSPSTTTDATVVTTTTTTTTSSSTVSSMSMNPIFGKAGKSNNTVKDPMESTDAKAQKVSKSGNKSPKSAKMVKAQHRSKSGDKLEASMSVPPYMNPIFAKSSKSNIAVKDPIESTDAKAQKMSKSSNKSPKTAKTVEAQLRSKSGGKLETSMSMSAY